MKTMRLKKLITMALIIIVLAAAILGGYQMILMSRLNALTLKKARWSCGGGMTGGHTSLEINLEGDHAVAVAEKQEWHNSDLERTTYILPAEVMDQLKALIIKNKLNVLSRRGYSRMIALDADTDHFYADFTEGYSFGVSETQKKTPAESKRFYEVRTLMYDLIKDAEGVTEVIPADQVDEEASGVHSTAETFGDLRKLCEPMVEP